MKTLFLLAIFIVIPYYAFAADIEITLIFPEAKATAIIDHCAAHLGYQDEIEDPENPGEVIPNPKQKIDILKAKIFESIDKMNEAGRVKLATDAARDQAITNAATDMEGVTVE